MKQHKTMAVLTFSIALAAAAATLTALLYTSGEGAYQYTSIRGQQVTIYGKGLYRHMSAEVAPQGLAQDCVTLLIGIPLLLLAYFKMKSGSQRWHFVLSGTVGYFLVTYLFYLVMGMYNFLFLLYAFLAGVAFFLFFQLMSSYNVQDVPRAFSRSTPVKVTGGFLVFNAAGIATLWLSVVVPPLLDGTLIPVQVEHYTTLIVQGLDLAILLPAALAIGLLLRRRHALGYVWAPVYFVFLSLLMTALTAKMVAMALLGYNVIPVVFIIPVMNVISVACSLLLLKNIKNDHASAYTKETKADRHRVAAAH